MRGDEVDIRPLSCSLHTGGAFKRKFATGANMGGEAGFWNMRFQFGLQSARSVSGELTGKTGIGRRGTSAAAEKSPP